METLIKSLSTSDLETIRSALHAASEGSFFPDWEFETLFGVGRATLQEVYASWPRRTVGKEDFDCAIINSLTNLVGYPHGQDDELSSYVRGGRGAVESALQNVAQPRV